MRLPSAAVIQVETPEGVPLRFDVATVGRRCFAFAVDSAIIFGSLFFALLAIVIIVPDELGDWAFAVFLVFSFLIRNFYFVIGEMRGRGQTFGKKLARIRVADVHGRPLSGNAIFLRNVTRDLETFLPFIAIFSPEAIMTGAPWWAGFLALGWLVVIGLLPFMTRQRLRAGDIVAGTVVVAEPAIELLDDVTENTHNDANIWLFSDAQLDMYGVFELQVLEDLLRESPPKETLTRVASKIANKIAESDDRWVFEPRIFLEAFYTQMRRRHETRILRGDRQEAKRQGSLHEEET